MGPAGVEKIPAFAYRLVARAIDFSDPWSPESLLASSIRHVIDGHVPAAHYVALGSHRPGPLLDGELGSRLKDLIRLDCNPLGLINTRTHSPDQLVAVWNSYYELVPHIVRTTARQSGRARVKIRRSLVGQGIDQPECRRTTVGYFNALIENARQNQKDPTRRNAKIMNVSGLASTLGLDGTIVHEAALVYETDQPMCVPQLARLLGTSRRTLARHFSAFGIGPQDVRMASMLLNAVRMMPSAKSLTEIATACGYSDSSHLTRTFRRSTGIAPTQLAIWLTRVSAPTAKRCPESR
jgi:AraC-like DNA-binding protein